MSENRITVELMKLMGFEFAEVSSLAEDVRAESPGQRSVCVQQRSVLCLRRAKKPRSALSPHRNPVDINVNNVRTSKRYALEYVDDSIWSADQRCWSTVYWKSHRRCNRNRPIYPYRRGTRISVLPAENLNGMFLRWSCEKDENDCLANKKRTEDIQITSSQLNSHCVKSETFSLFLLGTQGGVDFNLHRKEKENLDPSRALTMNTEALSTKCFAHINRIAHSERILLDEWFWKLP